MFDLFNIAILKQLLETIVFITDCFVINITFRINNLSEKHLNIINNNLFFINL